MSKVPICISVFDIEYALAKAGMPELESFSKEHLAEALYSIGFDKNFIEIDEVLHRPIYSKNNEPWFGKRFVSFERQDREWMFSGKSSLENVINSQEDSEHKKDLMLMSAESNNTLEICEHIEKSGNKG